MARMAGSPPRLAIEPFETTTFVPDFVAFTRVDVVFASTWRFEASALFLSLFRVFYKNEMRISRSKYLVVFTCECVVRTYNFQNYVICLYHE